MTKVIVLGGGCFWCTEEVFRHLKGVQNVEPGYAGGLSPHPTYEEVCSGDTGHAEVVRLEFDPAAISASDILHVFFSTHDPTTVNRQGNDFGTQYRSVIFYTSREDADAAKEVIAELTESKIFPDKIVTEIKPLSEFFGAEEYHHRYYEKHPEAGYCQAVINPKLAKLRKKYQHLLI